MRLARVGLLTTHSGISILPSVDMQCLAMWQSVTTCLIVHAAVIAVRLRVVSIAIAVTGSATMLAVSTHGATPMLTTQNRIILALDYVLILMLLSSAEI